MRLERLEQGGRRSLKQPALNREWPEADGPGRSRLGRDRWLRNVRCEGLRLACDLIRGGQPCDRDDEPQGLQRPGRPCRGASEGEEDERHRSDAETTDHLLPLASAARDALSMLRIA
jgi:hypothetical protein